MNQHFLEMCYFVGLVDKKKKEKIISNIMRNRNMINQFKPTCIGFVAQRFKDDETGFLISKKHPQITRNIRSLKNLKEVTCLREKYVKRIMALDRAGFSFLVGRSIDCESVVPIVNGKIKIFLNHDNQIIIPSVLSYDDWVKVTKATYPKEYQKSIPPKRRELVLKTIRHSIGIYDEAWKHLPDSCYGHICRRFIQTVCKKFPALDTVAKEWLEQKALSENVDKFELDEDYLWDTEIFFHIDNEHSFISELMKR